MERRKVKEYEKSQETEKGPFLIPDILERRKVNTIIIIFLFDKYLNI